MVHHKLKEQFKRHGIDSAGLPSAWLEELSYAFEEHEARQAVYEQQRHAMMTLIENASELICSLNSDYRLTMFNSAFKRIVEARLGGKVRFGASLREMLDPVRDDCWLADLERAFRGETFTAVRCVSFDGGSYWLTASYHPVKRENRVEGVTWYAQNITEQKLAELSLTDSENRYRTLVNQIKEVIFQTDAQGLWTFLNRSWTEVTGFTVQESLGQPFLDYVHPEDRERNTLLFLPLIRREKEYCRHVVRYVTKDGGYRHVEVHARLTLDEEDRIVGTSGTLTDITERTELEESMLRAKEEAEKANRAKSVFITRMSHELRTPLNAILGFSQLLQLSEPRLHPEQLDKTEEIIHAGEHLLALIHDILDLSRIEIGKLPLELTSVDLEQELRDCMGFVKPLAEEKRVKLQLTVQEAEICVRADRVRLKQVLLNLLSNALKYNRPGGAVSLHLARDAAEGCTVRIEDTGLGIREEDLPSLFEPYTRFHSMTGVEGIGVGLSISKHLVELMGGTISVESRLGEGTAFLIRWQGNPHPRKDECREEAE
ncbi:PAS domain-containing sensor histidine kinase [Gorillibacterium sp. sgz5001074]|uniref:PAS domain-containing sensor histidine kinase n=1 Tax=Gorillibacterium sp. sgz5001074 TaxID=3446695 RepID=UPI003F6693B6